MANEGSTKPTYSELEAENLRVRGLLQRATDALCGMIATFESGDHADKSSEFGICSTGMCAVCDAQEALDAAMSVIQIPTDAKSGNNLPAGLVKFVDDSIDAMTPEQLAKFRKVADAIMERVRTNFPQSSSPVSHGAESADIGKLDTADKKHAMINTPRNFSLRIEDESGVEMGKVNRVDEKGDG